ncbi:MAG: DNA polymerase III subunit alpha [Buchnera aphidicola (Eriosoma harunire)]
MLESKFIHLRVHSDYSLIHGLYKPQELLKYAVERQYPAMGMTDFSNLYGVIKFYKSSMNIGVKPIIGIDINILSEVLSSKLSMLTLLATNHQGYLNLITLISMAYRQGYQNSLFKIFIKQQWLLKYKKGLIVLSGGVYGDLGICLLRDNLQSVERCINFYKKHFLHYFYIEITRTSRLYEDIYINKAISLAYTEKLPLVATNDVCFVDKKDFKYHHVRVSIQRGLSVNNKSLLQEYSCEQYLKTELEMCKLFMDLPEALSNSVQIAKRCNVIIQLGKYFLPRMVTKTVDAKNFLIKVSKEGLEHRLKNLFPDVTVRSNNRNKYDLRLKRELSVINKMNFPGYFLIVMEFITWAKKHNISVGPGRGSGAGSLVAYALNITELDPLYFNLLFERFLNPERVSLPDLDIDFCIKNRDLVIEHVSKIYGKDAVAQIITFGTMTAKAVIKDVGRSLGYPYGFINRISKLIPMDPGMTLEKACIVSQELSSLYEVNVDVRKVITIARKLEGVTRNVSKHAGGVVISPTTIMDFSPLYYDSNGGDYPITQFDKNDIDSVGLLKFDFLGLKTLTIISSAVNMINSKKNKVNNILLDINSINLNDEKCFKFLRCGHTIAVFQLESRGMTELIFRLQPDNFEDIIALLALFRPGPLQSGMVDNFINRKHHREKIYYPDAVWQHMALKPILQSTYGIILYQEQVMQIAQELAGYTLGEADILRRAMGKKNVEEMRSQRVIFRRGSRKKGIDEQLSMKIFDLLEKFSSYGFNKSHSVAYALLSYQTLWLKVYHSSEFLAAAMNEEIDNKNRLMVLVKESVRLGIVVLSPDINYSQHDFFVNQDNQIVYGLSAIKGIGGNVILSIINERNKRGKFLDLFDLCIRVSISQLTHRVLFQLIISGALDSFCKNRSMLSDTLSITINAVKQYFLELHSKQYNIFGDTFKISKSIINRKNLMSSQWSNQHKLKLEREGLGFYLTGHPIDEYLCELKRYTKGIRIQDVCLIRTNNVKCVIFGIVSTIQKKITKNNDNFLIISLDDKSSKIDVIVFSQLIKQHQYILIKDKIIVIKGYVVVNKIFKNNKIIAQHILDLDSIKKV